LIALAEHRGEACPSCEEIKEGIRDFEYNLVAEWLKTAPAVDSPEYATMQEECISKVVTVSMVSIQLPRRHAMQKVHHDNAKWEAVFKKVCKQLVESSDAMFALLGSCGTGKTQMAVELIRFMVRHHAESAVNPTAHGLERWAWLGGFYPDKGLAHYSTTMDFFFELRATYKSGAKKDEGEVLQRFVRPRLLILDEVHDRRGTDWENSMFTC